MIFTISAIIYLIGLFHIMGVYLFQCYEKTRFWSVNTTVAILLWPISIPIAYIFLDKYREN